ncbi:MAG TPA: hypothetical protein VGS61_02655, partial [Acidimicrobiales bacterium]|nr:hypothetical protein [Acidimicrobiales bacterium]
TLADDMVSVDRTLEVMALAQEIGATNVFRVAQGNLAIRHAIRGEIELAGRYLADDLRWLRTAGAPPSWTGFQALVASSVFRSRGDLVRAAELAGAIESLAPDRESLHYMWSNPERRLRDENREALRAELGDEFERAFARGAVLTPEQTIDLAAGRRSPGNAPATEGLAR